MLTYSWIQFIDVPLCILYVAVSLKHLGEFMYMIDLWFCINGAFVGVCGWLYLQCLEQIILNICLEAFMTTDLNKTSARLTAASGVSNTLSFESYQNPGKGDSQSVEHWWIWMNHLKRQLLAEAHWLRDMLHSEGTVFQICNWDLCVYERWSCIWTHHKGVWESRHTASLILELGNIWPLPSRIEPWVHIRKDWWWTSEPV